MRTLRVVHPPLSGGDVRALQIALNKRCKARRIPLIAEDGVYGPTTHACAVLIAWLLGIGSKHLGDKVSVYVQGLIRAPKLRNPVQRLRAKERKKHYKPPPPLKRRFGIDYAWGTPNVSAFKSAGVTFVCRYVSTPGNSKNITKSEARSLSRAGFDIVLVFETTGTRASAGYAAGQRDARSARSQALAVGWPKDGVLYFAVDFDANPGQVVSYFDGVASVLGHDHCGPYAGVRVVSALHDRGFKFSWSTYAWSGGAVDPRTSLYQFSNGHNVGGVDSDYDRSLKSYFGQFRTA